MEKQKKELNKQQDAEIAIIKDDQPETNEALSRVLNLDIRDIADMKKFLMEPCPKGYRIECTIKRDRSGLNRFYPKYHCYISVTFFDCEYKLIKVEWTTISDEWQEERTEQDFKLFDRLQ